MYSVRQTISLVAADADGICQSQTPSAGGTQTLTMNGALVSGGVYTADQKRFVIITSAGNDTARTFRITGTYEDLPQTEDLAGANAAAATSLKVWTTVTSITIDGNSAGALTVGTNDQAVTAWILTDHYCKHKEGVSVQVDVSTGATLNYTVQHTSDDLQDTTYYSDPDKFLTILNNDSADIASATASNDGGYAVPPVAIRLKINSYTSGTAKLTVV